MEKLDQVISRILRTSGRQLITWTTIYILLPSAFTLVTAPILISSLSGKTISQSSIFGIRSNEYNDGSLRPQPDGISGPEQRAQWTPYQRFPPPTRGYTSPYQQQPRGASFCATPRGNCPLRSPQPLNSPCYCPSLYGPIRGIAR